MLNKLSVSQGRDVSFIDDSPCPPRCCRCVVLLFLIPPPPLECQKRAASLNSEARGLLACDGSTISQASAVWSRLPLVSFLRGSFLIAARSTETRSAPLQGAAANAAAAWNRPRWRPRQSQRNERLNIQHDTNNSDHPSLLPFLYSHSNSISTRTSSGWKC